MMPEAQRVDHPAASLPRLVDGIASWPFFPARRNARGELVDEGVSIVGSVELDRFLTVPNRKLRAVETILDCWRRSDSVHEAEERLRRAGLKADLSELCDKLWEAGLVLDDAGRPVPADSPLERNFVRLARVQLAPLAPVFRWLGRHLVGLAATLLAAATLAWWLAPGSTLQPLTGFFHGRAATWNGVAIGILLLAASFLLHETCHGAVASRFGRLPRRFELGFYLGLLPTFFLRIGGLYTLTPRQRVAVWAAGPASNLFLAATTAWLALHTEGGVAVLWTRATYLNLGLGLFNLVPFLPTDGYFIASTLLRRSNIRRRAWSSLRTFFAGGGKPALELWIYALGCSAVVVYLFGGRLLRIGSELHDHPLGAVLRLALTVTLVGLIVVRWRKARKTRSRRRRGALGVNS